jgi:hypothetical protein
VIRSRFRRGGFFDKAFDADARVLEPLAAAGKTVVIPPRTNWSSPRQYDRDEQIREAGEAAGSATCRTAPVWPACAARLSPLWSQPDAPLP